MQGLVFLWAVVVAPAVFTRAVAPVHRSLLPCVLVCSKDVPASVNPRGRRKAMHNAAMEPCTAGIALVQQCWDVWVIVTSEWYSHVAESSPLNALVSG